tara:strand:+ start:512 stop:853 length:342 start_codon:yes stop_codon:yes gene_type:complete
MNKILGMIGLVFGTSWITPVLADSADKGGYYYGHPMWSGGWTWGHMFMGWGMMAAFLIAVIVIVVLLTRGSGADGGRSSDASSALDILNERYARGEIDSAEYQERKKAISGKG